MKKLLAFVLALTLLLPFAACSPGITEPPLDGDNPLDTPEDGTESNGNGEEPVTTEGTVENSVIDFRTSETMYDETVLLVAETDAEGNVISAPKARLLFEAKEIVSVKQYFHENNGGSVVEFAAGSDYVYENGYLTAVGTIAENAITEKKEFNTSVPYVNDKAVTGEEPFPGLAQNTSIPSTDEGLYLPFTEGYQIVQMQLSVTYTHENTWTGSDPVYYGDGALSKTLAKLKNKESVELFVYGDSISTGANSSGYLNIEPYLDTWPGLVANNLARYFGTTVNLTNRAVGGWTSANGVSGGSGYVNGTLITQPGLKSLLANELAGYSPDVAFLGFGMNDASMGSPNISAYCMNMKEMIDTIRAVNPDCEIVLIGTMLANPKAKDQSKNQTEYTQYLSRVKALYEEGVCIVDIGAVHQELLDAGKLYTEMSSNNVNHPNDFMARVYAMELLAAFIQAEKGES